MYIMLNQVLGTSTQVRVSVVRQLTGEFRQA